MQFKTLVTFVSCAAMAVALPAENIVARTTPGQDAQSKCNANLEVQCCNSVIAGIGLGCVDLDLISVLPLGSQCSSSQKLACCDTTQTGTINVNLGCPQIL